MMPGRTECSLKLRPGKGIPEKANPLQLKRRQLTGSKNNEVHIQGGTVQIVEPLQKGLVTMQTNAHKRKANEKFQTQQIQSKGLACYYCRSKKHHVL